MVLILILISIAPAAVFAQDFSHLENLHTSALVDGKQEWIECPDWDWSLISPECKSRYMIGFNCLPQCGKYAGDQPDIGAMPWFPGQTSERPWGDWTGVPLWYSPHIGIVNNLKRK
jgi:hypothetical protein